MIRKAGLFYSVLLVSAGLASAQETQPPQTPPSAVQTAAPPAPATPLTREQVMARRDAIGVMEVVLAKAVKQGAENVVRQIQQRQQGLSFLTGVAKARGFILEDYGVVFHVEIPGVRAGVTSLVEQIERERQRSMPRAERAAGGSDIFDPNEAYTEAVKNTLIEKMLTYSVGLDLSPNEWLTIAARDGDEQAPGTAYDSITMIIRVRGADLLDFHAKRLTRDEVLKRVLVRGF